MISSNADFKDVWKSLVDRHGEKIAYYLQENPCSYIQLEHEAQYYRKQFSGQKIVRINGLEFDWLTQAIAAWTNGQLVCIYDPSWQELEPIRYELVMSQAIAVDWQTKPHLLLFTSGSTGKPKPFIRKTSFALYEALAYIEDTIAKQFDLAICLIKPWFGAFTKHCLGMLIAGIPQYFTLPNKTEKNTKTLCYGTPSLIAKHANLISHPWQAISLTGERVNANHIQSFKQCLDSDGFVLDAYGSTECGVIARRKLNYKELDKFLGTGFSGEILPGKEIIIDKASVLSVKALQESSLLTSDLARLEGNTLYLIGRSSTKRKIGGVWYDASPLLNLLSTHPGIYHVELSLEQTRTEQLIVYVCAHESLNLDSLYQWLFEHLFCIKLMPQLILSHTRPKLGVTGKQQIPASLKTKDFDIQDYISMMSEAIISLSGQNPIRSAFMDETLEAQGLSSLDIVSLMMQLEQKKDSKFPIRTLLKTDTPRQIAKLIQNTNRSLFRTLEKTSPQSINLICIGSGIIAARQQLSQIANLTYTDIIYDQTSPFCFSEIAKNILIQESSILRQTENIYLAGYSINALLAIELAYQMEIHQMPIKGIFLLDPPNLKRANYLKIKRPILIPRAKLLRCLVKQGKKKWQPRYFYELRKLAIAKQPKRLIHTPSITLYSQDLLTKHPWLKSGKHHQSLELNFSGHLQLVSTPEGINSWLPYLYDLTRL